MGTEYDELGPLGRDLAIWEIHLRSTGKSTHTIRSYVAGVRALAEFLGHQGLPLDPEEITTRHLRAFQAHLLLPEDQGGAGKRTST
ncbi:MAG TPA: phage integrase N-terminal SAM-like domain-containing protein, partial [Euzebyales bacterium]